MFALWNPHKRFCYRKNVIVFIILVILFGVTIYYVNEIDSFESHDNNITCHVIQEGDALPSAEDPNFIPKANSIFFHETSCHGGLNSRQACSIESAARAHPMTEIHVLFSGPVSEEVYRGSCIAELKEFSNIKFARVHLTEYGKNTPLEVMLASDPFKDSKCRIEHTSDVLRYLTIYKWGGVYLDTDIVVVKSLKPLGLNWVAKEDKRSLSNGAFAMSMDHLGRRLSNAIINEVKTDYRPDLWSYNGPGAFKRVLNKICYTDNPVDWSSKTCNGTDVYGPEYFYPIPYTNNDIYFTPDDLSYRDYVSAYTHHFWNKLTYNKKIEKDSLYANIAKQFCPTIYQMYRDEFGN